MSKDLKSSSKDLIPINTSEYIKYKFSLKSIEYAVQGRVVENNLDIIVRRSDKEDCDESEKSSVLQELKQFLSKFFSNADETTYDDEDCDGVTYYQLQIMKPTFIKKSSIDDN